MVSTPETVIDQKETQSFIPGVSQSEFNKMPRSHRRALWRAYLKDTRSTLVTKKDGDGRTENRKKYRIRPRILRNKYRKDGTLVIRKTESFIQAGAVVDGWVTALKAKHPEAMMTKKEKFEARLKEIAETDNENVPELILPDEDTGKKSE